MKRGGMYPLLIGPVNVAWGGNTGEKEIGVPCGQDQLRVREL